MTTPAAQQVTKISGSIKLTDLTFTDSLNDPSSLDYTRLESSVRLAVSLVSETL